MGLNLNFKGIEARVYKEPNFFRLSLTYPVAESR
jgi:hypothetical protein